eukprot:NODE_8421_length_384_cov_194.565350.p5 GENE.NODE_8421_length_384_cov_194.565350~~NODE_8421_length_384_cov_194.565350.p5  ORF type:complete len:66 (-),score=25.45 NODE_8421_length_384_cov_194.565350:130-327(-)
MGKQCVNGPQRTPLYHWLVGGGPPIEWNFAKFLVGRDGRVCRRFNSNLAPESGMIKKAIEDALAE